MLIPKPEDRPLWTALIFLAFAVFVVGALYSLGDAPYEQCAKYAGKHEAYKECVDVFSTEAVANYTKWLAGFTAILAFFTIMLAVASVWQGVTTQSLLELNRDQFNATFPPDIEILGAYILDSEYEPDADGLIDTGKSPIQFSVKLKFVNRGKTDAKVSEIACELFDTTPSEPDAEFFPWDCKDTPLVAGEEGSHLITRVHSNLGGGFGEATLHLIGYISYRDLAKKWHKTGFHLRRKPNFDKWEEVQRSQFSYRY